MLTDKFIDTVQDAKKKFVDAVVIDKEMQKDAHEFIEDQRKFTKTISKNFRNATAKFFGSKGE